MQWNNNVYRYRSQSLLYVAFLGFVFLIKNRGRCFFQLHKHARIFFFFKWDLLSCYSTRALQFFSLQNKSILVEASTRNCVWVMKALSWILLQNLRPGLPYTEWVIWLGGRFLCNLVYLKKNWHLKIYSDGVLSTMSRLSLWKPYQLLIILLILR